MTRRSRRATRFYTQAQAFAGAVRLVNDLEDHHRNRSEHRLARQLLETLPLAQLGAELQARLAWAYIETGDTDQGEAVLLTLRDRRSGAPRTRRGHEH